MKKQKNQLLIVFVLLVLCVGAYFFLKNEKQNQQKKEEEAAQEEEIPVISIDTASITGFSYVQEGEALSFVKQDKAWICEQYPETDLDESMIETMLSNVGDVKASRKLDGVDDLAAYGLDEPQNTITIQTGEDTVTFYVGSYNQTVYCYYFKMQADTAVYTMQSGLCTAFDKTLDDLSADVSENSAD